MATVLIKRKSQLANRFRKINIYLNNKWICKIADGDTKELDLEPGKYELKAKIDWTGSEKIMIEVIDDIHQEIELGCHIELNFLHILFSLFSFVLVLGSVIMFGEIKAFIWLILLSLWFIRDVVFNKGKSFLYYLFWGRDKYLYLKSVS